jgi:hypothetical protein
LFDGADQTYEFQYYGTNGPVYRGISDPDWWIGYSTHFYYAGYVIIKSEDYFDPTLSGFPVLPRNFYSSTNTAHFIGEYLVLSGE